MLFVLDFAEAHLLALQDEILESFLALERIAEMSRVARAHKVADEIPVDLVSGRDRLQVKRQLEYHLKSLKQNFSIRNHLVLETMTTTIE